MAMSYLPAAFLFGNRRPAPNSSSTRPPLGCSRCPAAACWSSCSGLTLLAVCGWQLRTALRRDYQDGLDLIGCSGATCRVVTLTGTVGIFARAVVFLPIGVFLVVAGVRSDARHVKGLDGLLMAAAGPWWGRLALAVVAACFAVFATYSVLEARYRDLQAGV